MRKSGPRSLSPSDGDELHGLDVEAQGLDRAGEAVLGLGEGADGCHCRVPFSNRAAPIATSMVVVRPGTIGPHPKGTASAPDGRRRLFCFAMQSAARAAEKSWRRLLREDDRGEAGLRSDPIHSRPRGGRRRWKLSGIRQATTAFRKRRRRHRVGHNRPAPQWQGFRTAFRMATPWATDALSRDAIVSVADDDSATNAVRSARSCDDRAFLAIYAAWLSRPRWHASSHEFEAGD